MRENTRGSSYDARRDENGPERDRQTLRRPVDREHVKEMREMHRGWVSAGEGRGERGSK